MLHCRKDPGNASVKRTADTYSPSPIPFARGYAINGAAVEHAVKQIPAWTKAEESRDSAARPAARTEASAGGEDASRFCPVCSQRLESRRCKLICQVCGYYMSCADYY